MISKKREARGRESAVAGRGRGGVERSGAEKNGEEGRGEEWRDEREWSARLSGRPLRVTRTKPRA